MNETTVTNRPVSVIVTHEGAHYDEILGIYFLQEHCPKEAENKFPGISTASIEYINDPNAVNDEELKAQGKIGIGCGKGIFDEHGRKDNVCAAELVARALNLTKDPVVDKLTGYARFADRERQVSENELPNLVKRWHRLFPNDPMFVMTRTFEEIRFQVLDAKPFFDALAGLEKAERRTLQVSGKEIKFMIIRKTNPFADNTHAIKAARKLGAHLIFKRNSKDQVGIFTSAYVENPETRIDLVEVTRLLRQAELTKRSIDCSDIVAADWFEEDLALCPWWHFMRKGQTILNGSDQSAKAVEGTALSDDEVIKNISRGISLTTNNNRPTTMRTPMAAALAGASKK